MKLIESIKIRLRAEKYKRSDDAGGIAYMNSSIRKGHTVLDIGAHKAGYLYHILNRVGETGKVYAFEPQQVLYQYIVDMKEMFNWHNVTAERVALSDTRQSATLYIPENHVSKGSSPGATILDFPDKSRFTHTETVDTDTIDLYCSRNKVSPDFIKIDVEGNELPVLYGGVYTLQKNKPGLLIEIDSRIVGIDQALETLLFLRSLGYTGHFIHGFHIMPIELFSFEKYQNPNDTRNFCNNFAFE